MREIAGVGLGFRFPHSSRILSEQPAVPWFEVITDDVLYARPRALIVESLAGYYPLAFHSVGLNIAGQDELDIDYVRQLSQVVNQYNGLWMSDHLCWSANGKRQHFDLLPFPFDESHLNYIASRVQQVQDISKRPLVLENISYYTRFENDEMGEWEFHAQLCQRTGCQVLLDLNNIWGNAKNFDLDPVETLNHAINTLPTGSIRQLHLAGATRQEDEKPYWIDAHAEAVPDPVVAMYKHFCHLHGPVPAIIERDNSLPDFSVMQQERDFLANCTQQDDHQRQANV